MMQNTSSLHGFHFAHSGWFMRAVAESTAASVRCFVSQMKEAATHERDRRHMAKFDMRMLNDIGLEPFDVYYGWRGSGRHH
ncbi:hypothetical protein [Microvirga solisilvae]|uniref:hypothetical protein n=1 Tax=Microvirga solisilvae TaxID=2919498 RepID=UPI001FAFFC14|nr:hypothetical protein [Microvirga solisilvae]